MNGFLRAAEMRALAMREEMLDTTPAKTLRGSAEPGRPKFTYEERMAARRGHDAERESRILAAVRMRAEGHTWEEVGIALGISNRERDTLAQAVNRRSKVNRAQMQEEQP